MWMHHAAGCGALACFWLAGVATVLPAHSLNATEAKSQKRWAILSSPRVQEVGLADLVFARLATQGLALVERDEITAIATESAVSQMAAGLAVNKRVKTGRLLNADNLILLDLTGKRRAQSLRVIIADCKHGARLSIAHYQSADETTAEAIQMQVQQVRTRFPKGIQRLLGVPPLRCTNLEHRYDHLSFQWRDLLTTVLATQSGVAVVELDEANVILKERSLTQVEGAEAALVVATGEFRIHQDPLRSAAGVHFQITLQTSDETRHVNKELPLSKAHQWITEDLARQMLTNSNGPPLSLPKQKETFVESADAFSKLGGWPTSTSLREAALVLSPDDATQRVKLVDEYQRQFVKDFDRLLFDPPEGEAEALQSLSCHRFVVGLEHLEWLVRNRQISRNEAIELFRRHKWEGTGSYWGRTPDRIFKDEFYGQVLASEDRFIREVLPLVLKLDPTPKFPNIVSAPRHPQTWDVTVTFKVWNQMQVRGLDSVSLSLLEHVLLKVFPADTPTNHWMCWAIRGSMQKHRSDEQRRYDLIDLMKELSTSKHEVARVYGRYARLELAQGYRAAERYTNQKALAATIEDIQAFEAALRKTRSRDQLFNKLRNMRGRLAYHLKSSPSYHKNSSDPAQAPATTGRLTFTPIQLPLSGEAIRGILACDTFDLLWTEQDLYRVPEPGKLVKVNINSEHKWPYHSVPNITRNSQVTWDGEMIWVAKQGFGAEVFRRDGKRVALFNVENGLPKNEHGLRLLALGPRRVLATGSFGEFQRGWCAILTLDPGPQVALFHEATRASGEFDARARPELDPTNAFSPIWVHRYRTFSGTDAALIGRRHAKGYPLLIHLDTLKASVLDYSTNCWSDCASFSHKGNLLQTATAWVSFFPTTKGPSQAKPTYLCRWKPGEESHSLWSQLIPVDEWLYVPGSAWFRIHTKTRRVERLTPTHLPQPFRNYRAGVSAHYGLVAHRYFPELKSKRTPGAFKVSIE